MVHITRWYEKRYEMKSVEDLIAIGTIGLIKGVSTYNYNLRTEFTEYITKYIKLEIENFIKKYNNEV